MVIGTVGTSPGACVVVSGPDTFPPQPASDPATIDAAKMARAPASLDIQPKHVRAAISILSPLYRACLGGAEKTYPWWEGK
jgi:hypothetical protein